MRTVAVIVVVAMAVIWFASGHTDSMASLAAADKLVAMSSHGRAHVERVFPGPGGLTGMVVVGGNQRFVAWTDASTGYVVVGPVFEPNGRNATTTAATALGLRGGPAGVASDQSARQVLYLASRATEGITQGKAKRVLYVYFDPNCVFCKEFYAKVTPAVAANQVSVRWIPVGFLKPDSVAKAATILASHKPLAAFLENERRFDMDRESGGVKALKTPPARALADVALNTRLLAASGGMVTPTVVYAVKGDFRVIRGVPRDMAAVIREAE